MQRRDLEQLSREELVTKAEALGILRARTLTMAELVDELSLADERRTGERKPRGWFGRARDLLTSVIDRGLAIPDAPKRRAPSRVGNAAPPPLPTVTLAEIYAAQGHIERAITTLDEVIAKEPAHEEALRLRERFQTQLRKTKPSSVPPPQVVPLTNGEHGASTLHEISAEAGGDTLSVGQNVQIGKSVAVAPAPEAVLDAAGNTAATPQEEQTFDVDEVVAVAVDPHTVYVYWEVRPKTFASARTRDPSGALVVRMVAITAAPNGPVTETRDVRVDALFGELFVRGIPAAAQVRLSIGYATAGGFEPFAVGLELVTPRARPAAEPARASRRWSEVRAEAEDPTLARPTAPRAAGPTEPRSETPAALPAPAWIENGPRFVQVSEPHQGGTFRHVSFHRLPGSSDIFRKEAFFSRGPFRPGVDSFAHRAAAIH